MNIGLFFTNFGYGLVFCIASLTIAVLVGGTFYGLTRLIEFLFGKYLYKLVSSPFSKVLITAWFSFIILVVISAIAAIGSDFRGYFR